MSLADRFPRLRNRALPDWVESAQDDDEDLIEAARKSQEDQANRLLPALSREAGEGR